MNKDKFRKRSGTTDQGKDYENLLVAYYSLKLVLNQEVTEFKISSNDEEYGNFDDLVIQTIWKDGSTEQFNIQAKHKQSNKHKNLLIEALRAEKGKFSIKKRFEEFEERQNQDTAKSILFTNRMLEVSGDTEITRDSCFVIYMTPHQAELEIINTSSKQNNVFKFYIKENDNATIDKSKLKEVKRYKNFFEHFCLYTSQKNVNEVRDAISTIFQNNFNCDSNAIKSYVDFVTEWSNHDGKKDKLTKEFLQLKIAESLFSPYVLTPSDNTDTEKSDLFKAAINAFDITVINNCDGVRNFYRTKIVNQIDLLTLNQTGLKYHIIQRYVKNICEISRLQRAILLWILDECPLILKITSINEGLILQTIKLCRNKKFVLLGTTKRLQNWKTFCNLSDLYNNHKDLYDDIVTTFSCSFQGQKEAYLEEIIDNDEALRSAFTTDELILMMENSCNFGGPKEILPDYYIERRLTKVTIDINFIEKFADVDSIVISCNGKLNFLKNYLQGVNFLMIDESSDLLNSPKDGSTEFFSKHNVYVASEECTREAFAKICEEQSACHHFQIDQSDNLEWLESSSSIENLRNFQTKTSHFIKEKNISGSQKLNLISADAGMGKSLMISNIKNNYLSKNWVLKSLLREHTTLFETCSDYQQFLNYIFDKSNLKEFDKKMFNLLMEKRKLVLIWDGIDEIRKEVFEKVVTVIEELKKMGFIQWITTRPNLKKILEDKFNVFAREIKPFGKKDQQIYIKKRLQFAPDLEKITEEIINKVDNENLGVPLQIFMLTELHKHNEKICRNLLTNTLPITKLFEYFVDEKFNFYYNKANIDLSNNIAQQIIEEHKEQRIEHYQTVALNLCLTPRVLSTLNLSTIENFLLKIEKENDRFGILEVRNGLPNFAHRTYAEYFVALWLSKNYAKIPNLEAFFFEENFKAIRFMFDLIMAKECPAHIAVLYKSIQELSNNLDKIHLEDIAGRSPLHIASSWGESHPLLNIQDEGKKFVIGTEKGFATKNEEVSYKEIVNLLVTKCNVRKRDKLFHFDCLQYADRSLSLASLEMFSKSNKIDLEHLKHFSDLPTTLCYIIKFDYVNLFGNIAEVPYVETNTGGSLLHLTAVFNRQHFLPKLLQNKMYKKSINKRDQKSWAPIHYASCYGHLEMIKSLRGMGGDIHLGSKNGEETPIFVAAHYGQLEVLTYLVQNNVDVNISKKNGWTPLLIASQKLNFAVINLLLKHGADINKTNREGYSPLYVATRKGDLEIVKLLVSKNAKVNMVGTNGEGPLYIAAKLGHLKVVKFLINKKANVNVVKKNGWTPLMAATRYGHVQVVKLLLENKALCDISSAFGFMLSPLVWKRESLSPLDIAAEKGWMEIAKLLLQHGAKVNRTYDQNSLCQAVCCGHLEMVKLLTEHGAEIKMNIVQKAAEKGYAEMVRFLMKNMGHDDRKNLKLLTEKGGFNREMSEVETSVVDGSATNSKKKKWIVIIILTMLVIVAALGVSSVFSYLINVK